MSLGASGDGEDLPLRMGLHDGNTSGAVDAPRAILESGTLNLDGLQGLVADSKAYTQRTLGLWRALALGAPADARLDFAAATQGLSGPPR